MNKKIPLLPFFVVLMISCLVHGANRGSSEPFISGDSFRAIADYTYDELSKNVDPHKIKKGDVIFLKTDYLFEFFSNVHPYISNKYVLITHNSDHHVPKNFRSYLDDEKLIAWFGQNIEEYHPKLHPIPIGIANREWPHGNVKMFKRKQLEAKKTSERDILLFMSFSTSTYPERNDVYRKFIHKSYCFTKTTSNAEYLALLGRSKFVLSPRGNGIDCHRTWEALIMGAIPIVIASSLDPMYKNLPVLVIQDWDEIDEDFLKQKYFEFQNNQFDESKKFFSYWKQRILLEKIKAIGAE